MMINVNSEFYKPYNYGVSCMDEVKKICSSFLNQFKLNHFWYSRIYPDGSFIDIGLDPSWFEYILENGYYDIWNTIRTSKNYWPQKEIKFNSLPEDLTRNYSPKNLRIISEKYKIFYSFNIMTNKDTYLENFGFSASKENYESIYFYSNYFGIFKAFGEDFAQKAFHIINEMQQRGKIIYPLIKKDFKPLKDDSRLSNLSCLNETKNNLQDWTNQNIKKFFLCTPSKEIGITPRQREILFHLSTGKSYKEISKALNIESKTVENHMQRLKDKTSLISKSSLIKAFLESGI